jgi:hypothetical protein
MKLLKSPQGSSPGGLVARIPETSLARKELSRRQFVKASIGSAALLAGSSAYAKLLGQGSTLPNPIPGGLDVPPFIHILLPGYPGFGLDPATNDPSTINDFNGHVGLTYVRGMGTRTDLATGATARLPFEVDLRFMKGEYVGSDGRRHHGAFALV